MPKAPDTPARPEAFVALILHAHLPFVRHPEHADSLEERWLFEAILETYLPLLEILRGWRRDLVDFRLTLSLSPTLLAMLDDPLLRERCGARLEKTCELADHELARTAALAARADPDEAREGTRLHQVAWMYHERFRRARDLWLMENEREGLAGAFAEIAFSESGPGRLELITCGATHAFLPLWSLDPATTHAQVRLAAETFARRFGRAPGGFWSPECGYYPGLEKTFADAGLTWFVIDTHAALFAADPPRHGAFAPVRLPNGVAAFPREIASARQVWSAEEGYPGDPRYREFYRDIGHDLPMEHVGRYIHESGLRVDTGFKYHRVTDRSLPLDQKDIYDPEAASAAVEEHAADFIARRQRQAAKLRDLMNRPPLFTAPYDAELFGHWWFEGPMFLDRLMRKLCAGPGVIDPITPSEYLARFPDLQVTTPAYSSWGQGGYAGVWLNDRNDWIHREAEVIASRARELVAREAGTSDPLLRRALDQLVRELSLAQSSDWPFIIHQGTSAQYAETRAREHMKNASALCEQIDFNAIDERALAAMESRNNLFPWLRFEMFA